LTWNSNTLTINFNDGMDSMDGTVAYYSIFDIN
jgi:hypothetical protein